MFWNAYGAGTILPAHANQGFHFYCISMHGLFYQQKIHIRSHYFRLILVQSKSMSSSVYEASQELEIQREWCSIWFYLRAHL